jgi:hypothetical protein
VLFLPKGIWGTLLARFAPHGADVPSA